MDQVQLSTASSTLAQSALSSQNAATGFTKMARSEKDFAETAMKFESMFMAQMLQPMFSGLGVDDTFGGGHGEEMMRGLLTQEYGKAMAAKDQSGLSDAIKNQMLHLQEQANTRSVAA